MKATERKARLSDAQVIRRWAFDPLAFVQEAIRVSLVTEQQRSALEEYRKLITARIHAWEYAQGVRKTVPTEEEVAYCAKKGLSIQSGQGTGKDAFAAWCILHFLICFPYPKIPATAPTQHQLRDVLWAETQKWIRHSVAEHRKLSGEQGLNLGAWLTWQADRIYLTELKGREWFAVARTANPKGTAEEQAETLQGFHEDNMLIIADEASGIPDPVFRPLEGTLTGRCNFAIVIFNPTRSSGFAIDTQMKERARWACLRWNAEDSEIVTHEHCQYMAAKYGRDSNAYRVRVLGLPPKADADTLIPYEWAIDAIGRDIVPLDDDPLCLGVDVARGGDDKSAFLFLRGGVIEDVRQYEGVDTEELALRAIGAMTDREPDMTFVDVIGIGAGVADKLQHRTDFTVIDVNVAELASEDDRFNRLRDELWFRVRELFEARKISITEAEWTDELVSELTTIKLLPPTDNGKIKVEAKKDMKKRGINSPNIADALCLCMYYASEVRRRMGRGRGVRDAAWHRRHRGARSWKTA